MPSHTENHSLNATISHLAKVQTIVPYLMLVVSLCILYVPTFIDLFSGLWRTEQQAHGPIVLAIATWFFFYKSRIVLKEQPVRSPSPAAGWAVLVMSLLLFVIGRSQAFLVFEVGSLILMLLSLVLISFGSDVAKRMWFVFFFMIFMIPIPGSVVDAVTLPMKLVVSYSAEQVLYWLGYPVARSGVVLNVGQYQLMVADACAGLNSLFTLEALGLLYLNVMRHESVFRNALLAVLIVPISFTANIIRVVALSLITYHFGDAAGQGFLHQFSSLVLLVTALLIIIFVDSVLRTAANRWNIRSARSSTVG